MRTFLLILVLAVAAIGQAPPARVIVCTDAGASDTYTCTPGPTVTSLTNALVLFTPNTVNTGAATLQIDSTAATSIVKASGNVTTALKDGDLQAGQKVWLRHDGTNFQLMSPSGAPNVRYISAELIATSGTQTYIVAPFACTITGWNIALDVSGSATIDIWKDTSANAPATDADSITASAVPTISAAVVASSTTLTDWTTSVAVGDYIVFNLDSITTATKATIRLSCVQ